MATHELEREQRFSRTPGELFPFFADAQNLSLITPEFLDFCILSPMPMEMRTGARLDYRLRLLGMPVTWKTRIEAFDAPHAFVDTQIQGPYRLWTHTHSFEEVAGGTLMRDVVRYRLPYGPLGALAHALFIRRILNRIFDYRREALEQIFGDRVPA